MVRDGLFLVRIYGEKHNDHWALVSLDFGVAAQGKTVEEALSRLDEQIKEYTDRQADFVCCLIMSKINLLDLRTQMWKFI